MHCTSRKGIHIHDLKRKKNFFGGEETGLFILTCIALFNYPPVLLIYTRLFTRFALGSKFRIATRVDSRGTRYHVITN